MQDHIPFLTILICRNNDKCILTHIINLTAAQTQRPPHNHSKKRKQYKEADLQDTDIRKILKAIRKTVHKATQT